MLVIVVRSLVVESKQRPVDSDSESNGSVPNETERILTRTPFRGFSNEAPNISSPQIDSQ